MTENNNNQSSGSGQPTPSPLEDIIIKRSYPGVSTLPTRFLELFTLKELLDDEDRRAQP